MNRLNGDTRERVFLNQVMEKSGQNLTACLQCGKCTGGCPIASEKVGGPRQLIASILLGLKEQALQDPTWLYCVSCGTCATRCPVEISMYPVATALCEIAELEAIVPAEKHIHLFEKVFLNSVRKYGRVPELRTVMEYNLRTLNPFKDLSQGFALMLKGAITPLDMLKGFKRDKIAGRIFARVQQTENGGIQ